MKEATGELSTTVIAIVAIAAILAVFTVFLLPTLRAQITLTQACNSGPNYSSKHENSEQNVVSCGPMTGTGKGANWVCHYYDESGKEKGQKTCTQ